MPDDVKKLQVAIEAKSNLSDVATGDKKAVESVTQATADQTKEEAKQTETTSSLELKKRELLESLRGITREYPIVGEAARAAFNPIVLATAGVIESVNIWLERLQTAQEMLGGWELPDMTTHSVGVTAAAEAYEKLKTAVSDANMEFNSAAGIYERQAKAVEAQLTATKQLIEANKKKAEADLDVQKATGQISPEEFIQRKAELEKWSIEQTEQAETDARNNRLAAQKQEIDNLGRQAAGQSAKAVGIQPGLNDAALDELIKKVQADAAEAGKKADEFRSAAKYADELAVRAQGGQGLPGLADVAHSIPGDVAFFAKYGLTANPEEVAKMNRDQAKQAEETQSNLEKQAQLLDKQKEARDKATTEAARLRGLQATKYDEYQADSDPTVVGSTAWQNAQAAARSKVNSGTANSEENARIIQKFQDDAAKLANFDKSTSLTPDLIRNASRVIEDMHSALNDHAALLRQIVGLAADIRDLRRAQSIVSSQISRAAQNTLSQ